MLDSYDILRKVVHQVKISRVFNPHEYMMKKARRYILALLFRVTRWERKSRDNFRISDFYCEFYEVDSVFSLGTEQSAQHSFVLEVMRQVAPHSGELDDSKHRIVKSRLAAFMHHNLHLISDKISKEVEQALTKKFRDETCEFVNVICEKIQNGFKLTVHLLTGEKKKTFRFYFDEVLCMHNPLKSYYFRKAGRNNV
jgi:hypothetical protein